MPAPLRPPHLRAALCACLALALLAPPGHAQRPAPVDSIEVLAGQAMQAYRLGTREGTETAILRFALVAELEAAAGRPGDAGQTLASIGTLQGNLGRADSALAYYDRSLHLLREAGDRASEATVLALIGQTHHGRGDVATALRFYRESLPMARAASDRDGEGRGLNNLGIALRDLGQPDSALVYLRQAVALRRETENRQGEAVALNNLARVHELLGRPDSAVAYLRLSLAASRAAEDRLNEARTLNNLGLAFEMGAQPDSALAYYSSALPLREASGNAADVGLTLTNIGRTHLALGHPDTALAYASRGLARLREAGDRSGEAWALDDLGRIHQALGRPDSAGLYLQEALRALREVGDRAREGVTLFHLAQLHHRGGRAPRLAAAVAYYDSAAAIRSTVGGRAGGDANQVSFAEQDVRLFEEWALAWLSREGEVGEEAAARAALAAAERGRAQALLTLMQDSTAGWEPGADLPAEGARLASRARRPGGATVSYLAGRDTLVTFLVTPAGAVRAARRPVGRDSLALLVGAWRAGLGADGAPVPGGRAMPALEDARGIRPTRQCTPEERRGIRPRRGTCAPEDAEVAAVGTAIAEALLPSELRAGLPRRGELVVVPHGVVGLVPFAALPLAGRGRPASGRFALRYAPSLATLAAAEALAEPAAGAPLVVGNPAMPVVQLAGGAEAQLPPLPASGRESHWVAARLGGEALTGLAATEAAVRERLPDARVVHLATHGYAYASEAAARESFIALAPAGGDDGLLRVREVLAELPPLSAELVVLSACQTGLGDLKQAEGTIGLQRAFLARGARSVLVSLWSVSDEATEALMKAFYRHWLEDRDRPGKAEALRRAQEDVRRMRGFEHPRFWGAFQLVGAP